MTAAPSSSSSLLSLPGLGQSRRDEPDTEEVVGVDYDVFYDVARCAAAARAAGDGTKFGEGGRPLLCAWSSLADETKRVLRYRYLQVAHNLAFVLQAKNCATAAIGVLQHEALGMFPRDPCTLCFSGRLCIQMGCVSAARAVFEQLEKLMSSDPDWRATLNTNRALLCLSMRNFAEAEAWFAEVHRSARSTDGGAPGAAGGGGGGADGGHSSSSSSSSSSAFPSSPSSSSSSSSSSPVDWPSTVAVSANNLAVAKLYVNNLHEALLLEVLGTEPNTSLYPSTVRNLLTLLEFRTERESRAAELRRLTLGRAAPLLGVPADAETTTIVGRPTHAE